MEKKEKILKKMSYVKGCHSLKEDFQGMSNEEKDLYRFLCGGFAAK